MTAEEAKKLTGQALQIDNGNVGRLLQTVFDAIAAAAKCGESFVNFDIDSIVRGSDRQINTVISHLKSLGFVVLRTNDVHMREKFETDILTVNW